MKGIFLVIFGLILWTNLSESSTIMKENRRHQFEESQLDPQILKNIKQNLQILSKKPRLMTITTQTSKPNYVISTWIKKYSSRNQICHYLCQSDSYFTFLSDTSCLVTYKCSSVIWQNIIILFVGVSYIILPIFMMFCGVWSFRCWGDHLAFFTGIVFANIVYQKLSRDFQQDMETDYNISNSEIQSDFKSASQQNSE